MNELFEFEVFVALAVWASINVNRLTDRQTHRKDKNYIPPLHTLYAGGIKRVVCT